MPKNPIRNTELEVTINGEALRFRDPTVEDFDVWAVGLLIQYQFEVQTRPRLSVVDLVQNAKALREVSIELNRVVRAGMKATLLSGNLDLALPDNSATANAFFNLALPFIDWASGIDSTPDSKPGAKESEEKNLPTAS